MFGHLAHIGRRSTGICLSRTVRTQVLVLRNLISNYKNNFNSILGNLLTWYSVAITRNPEELYL